MANTDKQIEGMFNQRQTTSGDTFDEGAAVRGMLDAGSSQDSDEMIGAEVVDYDTAIARSHSVDIVEVRPSSQIVYDRDDENDSDRYANAGGQKRRALRKVTGALIGKLTSLESDHQEPGLIAQLQDPGLNLAKSGKKLDSSALPRVNLMLPEAAAPSILPPPTREQVLGYQRQLAEEKAREKQEEANRINGLENFKKMLKYTVRDEANTISVFNDMDLEIDIVAGAASMVAERAKTRAVQFADIGNIDALGLTETKDAWENAGVTLIKSLVRGQVEGASPLVIAEIKDMLKESDINLDISNVESKTPRARRFLGAKAEAGAGEDLLDAVDNKLALKIVHQAVQRVSRSCSATAHEEFFSNIALIEDGSVMHRTPAHPEKYRMEHDFDQLVQSLQIPEDQIFKKALGDFSEHGFYLSLSGQRKDPMDIIIERLGGPNGDNISNVDRFGNGAFVALVPANNVGNVDESERGGYLVFGYHPLVPGYQDSHTMERRNVSAIEVLGGNGPKLGVESPKFNIRNARPTPVMDKEDVIQMPVNTWHLTSDGYAWLLNEFKKGRRHSFADPRYPLREGHKLVVEDVERRREGIEAVQTVRDELAENFNNIIGTISSMSAETLSTPEGKLAIEKKINSLKSLLATDNIGLTNGAPALEERSQASVYSHETIDGEVVELGFSLSMETLAKLAQENSTPSFS